MNQDPQFEWMTLAAQKEADRTLALLGAVVVLGAVVLATAFTLVAMHWGLL